MAAVPDERTDGADRGVGIMLGGMIGDVLGAPFEGENSATIQTVWKPPFDVFDGSQLPSVQETLQLLGLDVPSRIGEHTDDTEALCALAFSLVELKGLYARHAALSWAWFWIRPKRRSSADASTLGNDWTGGYSAWTFAKLSALARGQSYRETALLQTRQGQAHRPEAADSGENELGSWGNGGAMRIAPVGVAYRTLALSQLPLPVLSGAEEVGAHRPLFDQPADDQLYSIVAEALASTHCHPEAIDSSTIIARAIAYLVDLDGPAGSTPIVFLRMLLRTAHTQAMRDRLAHILDALSNSDLDAATRGDSMFFEGDKKILEDCCSAGKWFQIRSVDAVATAVFFFAKYGGLGCQASADCRPETALIRAILCGGDTDTVGSMVGALLGALHGSHWISDRWLATASQDPDFGVPKMKQLGRQLSQLQCSQLILETDSAATAASDALLHAMSSLPLPSRLSFDN